MNSVCYGLLFSGNARTLTVSLANFLAFDAIGMCPCPWYILGKLTLIAQAILRSGNHSASLIEERIT